jgi:hypothetical protein
MNSKKHLEENAGVFRRCLNGFFQSNFLGDKENLEALRLAISIEDLILSSGYRIDYYITSDGRILRANKIIPNSSNKNQKITIKEKFGHLLPKDEPVEEVVKDINYYKGKLVYNRNLKNVGVITGYSPFFPSDPNSKMRFSFEYVKDEKKDNVEFTLSTSAWVEDVCMVFDDRLDLFIYIENSMSSMFDDCNSLTDLLDRKLDFLGYQN